MLSVADVHGATIEPSFQNAPRQFLERTVLFTDQLSTPETLAKMRHATAHHIDLHPQKERSSARLLAGLHQYADLPLTSYFGMPGVATFIKKEDPPFHFVFFPDFVGCRLLLQSEGVDYLKLQVEEGLAGSMPPLENSPDSTCLDSFAYWDYTHGHLVGKIRATVVLVKEPGQPWNIFFQQIVGATGFEVVRTLFSRPLRY